MKLRIVTLALVIACNAPPPAPVPGSPRDLAAYLAAVAGTDRETRAREVATWLVPEATWDRTLMPPYRALYADYAANFSARAAALVDALAPLAPVTARRHYAGDRELTLAEARLRWALPVQYPSAVADIGGAPIDAVFLYDGEHWRALAGVDELVLARVRALDATCAVELARAGPLDGALRHCSEVGALVASAALRGARAELARACGLANTLCGTPAP